MEDIRHEALAKKNACKVFMLNLVLQILWYEYSSRCNQKIELVEYWYHNAYSSRMLAESQDH